MASMGESPNLANSAMSVAATPIAKESSVSESRILSGKLCPNFPQGIFCNFHF
jgi:hypothetical protein